MGILGYSYFQFSTSSPGGYEFAKYYLSTRSFLVDGTSPYSDTVQQEISRFHQSYFGAQLADAYATMLPPFYAFFLFFPLAPIKYYVLARAIWMTLQTLMLVVAILLAIDAFQWKPNRGLLIVLILISMVSHFSIRAIALGGLEILLFFLLVLLIRSIQRKNQELSGVILACLTIDINGTWLLLLFTIVWLISRRRWRTLAWAFGSITGLTLVGMIFIRNWVQQYFWMLFSQTWPNPVEMLTVHIEAWLPGIATQLSWITVSVIVLLLLFEWGASLRKEFSYFHWTICYTFLITHLVNAIYVDDSSIGILLPLLLIFSVWDRRWEKSGGLTTTFSYGLLCALTWSVLILYGRFPESRILVAMIEFSIAWAAMYWIKYWFVQYRPPGLRTTF